MHGLGTGRSVEIFLSVVVLVNCDIAVTVNKVLHLVFSLRVRFIRVEILTGALVLNFKRQGLVLILSQGRSSNSLISDVSDVSGISGGTGCLIAGIKGLNFCLR